MTDIALVWAAIDGIFKIANIGINWKVIQSKLDEERANGLKESDVPAFLDKWLEDEIAIGQKLNESNP